jgi:hypothetical protein
MRKSIAAIAGLTAILSLGSLIPAYAGGGATSAPSKYNNVSQNLNQNQWRTQHTSYTITEFSSSSAKSAPKR